MRPFIPRRFLDLLQAALLAGLALAGLPGRAQSLAPPLSLDQAVQASTARSQRVVAAQAQTRAARERVLAAGQLPDPVLKVGVNNLPVDGPDRFSLTRDFMTMRSIGVMQEFTRDDKRGRARRASSARPRSPRPSRAALADLQRDTAMAWLDRHYQERMRELLRTAQAQAALQIEAAPTPPTAAAGARRPTCSRRARRSPRSTTASPDRAAGRHRDDPAGALGRRRRRSGRSARRRRRVAAWTHADRCRTRWRRTSRGTRRSPLRCSRRRWPRRCDAGARRTGRPTGASS